MLNTANIKAQITLDFKVDTTFYGYLFYPVKISDKETKYVFLDTVNDKFSLYNLDMTPFILNISVPHPLRFGDPSNTSFYHVMYITRSLFDCDTTDIEYLFAAENAPNNPLWVIRTDGTILFNADSTRGPYCLGCPGGTTLLRPILTTESGTKLVLMKDYSSSTGSRNISIYSICGSLPMGEEEYNFSQNPSAFVQIYPNPSSMQLNFEISLPDNLNKYELIIMNGNSQELMRQHILFSHTQHTLDVQNYPSGTYYYSFASKDRVMQTGKFVIVK